MLIFFLFGQMSLPPKLQELQINIALKRNKVGNKKKEIKRNKNLVVLMEKCVSNSRIKGITLLQQI
jgi:hypothetical protein